LVSTVAAAADGMVTAMKVPAAMTAAAAMANPDRQMVFILTPSVGVGS
jgi:hypothetical protein